MKLVIQRVNSASVSVDGDCIASIKRGLLVFLGIKKGDTHAEMTWLTDKLLNMRVFEKNGVPMQESIQDIQGEILIVSQFTLYGALKKGRRPDYTEAEIPEKAEIMVQDFVDHVSTKWPATQKGQFQAHMQVSIENDGPVTLILEK